MIIQEYIDYPSERLIVDLMCQPHEYRFTDFEIDREKPTRTLQYASKGFIRNMEDFFTHGVHEDIDPLKITKHDDTEKYSAYEFDEIQEIDLERTIRDLIINTTQRYNDRYKKIARTVVDKPVVWDSDNEGQIAVLGIEMEEEEVIDFDEPETMYVKKYNPDLILFKLQMINEIMKDKAPTIYINLAWIVVKVAEYEKKRRSNNDVLFKMSWFTNYSQHFIDFGMYSISKKTGVHSKYSTIDNSYCRDVLHYLNYTKSSCDLFLTYLVNSTVEDLVNKVDFGEVGNYDEFFELLNKKKVKDINCADVYIDFLINANYNYNKYYNPDVDILDTYKLSKEEEDELILKGYLEDVELVPFLLIQEWVERLGGIFDGELKPMNVNYTIKYCIKLFRILGLPPLRFTADDSNVFIVNRNSLEPVVFKYKGREYYIAATGFVIDINKTKEHKGLVFHSITSFLEAVRLDDSDMLRDSIRVNTDLQLS